MLLTASENRQLHRLLRPYEKNEHVQEMKKYIQHGTVTTYDHCLSVTCVSFWMNRRLHLKADEKALVTGAFLHDFYLYDWHVPEAYHRLHGYFHADVACRNAVKYFDISPQVQAIIKTHMFPLNITRVPKSREAAIVCAADKICSTLETVIRGKRGFRICG